MKILKACVQISKNVLSNNKYRKECAFKSEFVLALLRLYYVSIKALLRLYYVSIKALLRLY
jgi:hypothetical protein